MIDLGLAALAALLGNLMSKAFWSFFDWAFAQLRAYGQTV